MSYTPEPIQPRRRKRLPQLSKRNRKLSRNGSKSEFLNRAPIWDARLIQKFYHEQ